MINNDGPNASGPDRHLLSSGSGDRFTADTFALPRVTKHMHDWFKTEDWWAVWIGLFVVALSLGVLGSVDLLGWSVDTKEWMDVTKAFVPVVGNDLPGIVSLLGSFAFLLLVVSFGAWCIGLNVRRFAASFAVIFAISYACLLIGHNAYIAATPDKRAKFGIGWSLGLTGEAGYIIALLVGVTLGNFAPSVVNRLREAARPEWSSRRP